MEGSVKDLSRYHYERAAEELDDAQPMVDERKYKFALNLSKDSISKERNCSKPAVPF